MSKILFILITTSVIFTGCIDNNEKSAEDEAPAGNPPAESETTENDNSCGNDYIYSKTKNSITWQDVYDKQKKYDLEKPEDILDEFGDRRFNPQYSRYETGYNLHNKTIHTSSGQNLFLDGYDGHMYTYLHDLKDTLDYALVILFTVAYSESGYEIFGSKYEREEIHFISMSKNSSNKWDVNKIKTMDIATSERNIGISKLYYLNISNSIGLSKEEDVLLNHGFNDKWVFTVTSRGGQMGSYWSRDYTYKLNDLNCVLSNGTDHYEGWDDNDNINYELSIDIFGDTLKK